MRSPRRDAVMGLKVRRWCKPWGMSSGVPDRDPFSGRHVRLRLTAEAANVAVARHAVAELIADRDVEPERRDGIVLAISEAVSNAVIHAYPRMPSGMIEVFAIRSRDELIVSVTDRGCGLERPSANPGMGMGLQLIRGAAEQALISAREHGGTVVQCRFLLVRRQVTSDA
jgi:anti-sigma regulatory factor (Ser/Thr protein kinase)